MQILGNFFVINVNTLDGTTYDQHDCRLPQTDNLEKNHMLNSCKLFSSFISSNVCNKQKCYRIQMSTASWTFIQYVHHSPVRQPEGDASTGWYCHQWTSVTVRTTPTPSPASIVPCSQTFYHGTNAPVQFDEGDILKPQVHDGVPRRVNLLHSWAEMRAAIELSLSMVSGVIPEFMYLMGVCVPWVEGVDFGVVCPHWLNGFNVVLIVVGAI